MTIPTIGFIYDEELDAYVLRADKQVIIDTGDNDFITFSRNQVIQTSQKLYLNPVPFYRFIGDLDSFRHSMREYSKQVDDYMTKLYTDHKLNSDGTVSLSDCTECATGDS